MENGITLLKNNIVNLDKCIVNINKKQGIDLFKYSARVAVVLDFSRSMSGIYKSGAVQRTLNRLVPLGLRFDDNKQLDAWIFHGGFKRLKSINIYNFEDYVKGVIIASGEKYGKISYSPVIRDILTKYTVENPDPHPVFVVFITDGSNDDRTSTNNIIRESSNYNIFIQFVGLGNNDKFDYLRKLDELNGRKVDNTGFIKVADFDNLDDEELYNELLKEYVNWIKATHYWGLG